MKIVRYALLALLTLFSGACTIVMNPPAVAVVPTGGSSLTVLNISTCEALKNPNPFADNPGVAAAFTRELVESCTRQLARLGYAQEHNQYRLERRAYYTGLANVGTYGSFNNNSGARAAYLRGLAENKAREQYEQEYWARNCARSVLCFR